MNIIEMENGSFSYGKREIFHNIELKIEEGQCFCIMGRNGCGKSTLLDSLLGINRLNKGSILVRGKDLSTMKSRELAKYISYVPQIPEKTFPYTVREMVLMGRTVHAGFLGRYAEEDYRIVDHMMEKLGISSLSQRCCTELSGGEVQMIMLARALSQETDIIIMDEPTAHLDYYNEMVFLETTAEMVREENKTVVMATHSPNQAFFLEKRVPSVEAALMNHGRIAMVGKPCQVLSSENIRNTYSIEAEILEGLGQKIIMPLSTAGYKDGRF